jgi:hypothetical protein
METLSDRTASVLDRLYIHNRVQTVIQGDLVPVLHRVNKQTVRG